MGYVLPGVAFCWVGPQYFVAYTQAFWNSHFQVVGAEMRPLACRAGSQSLQLDLAHSLEWLPQRQLSCLSSLAPIGHSPRCVLSGRSRLSLGGAVLRRTRNGGAQLWFAKSACGSGLSLSPSLIDKALVRSSSSCEVLGR